MDQGLRVTDDISQHVVIQIFHLHTDWCAKEMFMTNTWMHVYQNNTNISQVTKNNTIIFTLLKKTQ